MSEAANPIERRVVPGAPEAVYAHIVDALRSDAIIRDEEDAVGRFAGVRTVMFQGRRGDRLSLLRGPWSTLKKRADTPMLNVQISAHDEGSAVEIEGEAPAAPSGASKLLSTLADLLSVALTIALLAYAVNRFRGLDVDWARLALIALGGAVLYTIARRFTGEAESELEGAAWLRAEVGAALDELKSEPTNSAAAVDEGPAASASP